MNSVYDILLDLKANNGRLAKLDILRSNEDNKTLRRVVEVALNPFINFYQRKIPSYTTQISSSITLDQGIDIVVNELAGRRVTGNRAIDRLAEVLSNMDENDAEVLKRVVLKDLKCGVARSTANAIWPNLIAEFPVMLCSQYSKKLVDKISWPAAVQLKMDGMRFNAIVNNGKCEFRSRSGKEIDLLGYLEDDFVKLAKGNGNLVFDGELLVASKDGVANRQTGNGILNKAVRGTISDNEADLVCATVWDVIPFENFTAASLYTVPYSERYQLLIDMGIHNSEKISLVKHEVVNTFEEANTIFQKYLDGGEEGIILKDLNGAWENKRAKHQIKFKAELDCDLKIVGIENGTGKYEGMLGAIICESIDGSIKVSVGSGFSDEQRQTFGNDIIGKIAAIKYNGRIKSKGNEEESLFLPIFLEVREDKNIADHSKDIK